MAIRQRFRYEGSPLDRMIAELPGLVQSFMAQAQDEKWRERQVEREDAYRETLRIERSKEIKENQYLQLQVGIRTDLITMARDKENEYNTLLDKYNTQMGKTGTLNPLDITTDLSEINMVLTDNALTEVANDAGELNSLIKEMDINISQVNNRIKVLDEVKYQMAKNGHWYQTDEPDADGDGFPDNWNEDERKMGIALWSREDMRSLMNTIQNDQEFLKDVGTSLGIDLGAITGVTAIDIAPGANLTKEQADGRTANGTPLNAQDYANIRNEGVHSLMSNENFIKYVGTYKLGWKSEEGMKIRQEVLDETFGTVDGYDSFGRRLYRAYTDQSEGTGHMKIHRDEVTYSLENAPIDMQWLVDYFEQSSTPDEGQLAALNAPIIKQKTTALQYELAQSESTLKQIALEDATDPVTLYGKAVTKYNLVLKEVDTAFGALPGFVQSFNLSMNGAAEFDFHMQNDLFKHLDSPDGEVRTAALSAVAEMMYDSGVIEEEHMEFMVKHKYTDEAKDFLRWYANRQMVVNAPMAMITGPDYFRSIFKRDEMHNTSYANLIMTANFQIDRYEDPSTPDKEKELMEKSWARALGWEPGLNYSSYKGQVKNQLMRIKLELSQWNTNPNPQNIYLDNDFMGIMEGMQKTQENLQILLKGGSAGFQNSIQAINNGNGKVSITSSTKNGASLKSGSDCKANGGQWNDATGACYFGMSANLFMGASLVNVGGLDSMLSKHVVVKTSPSQTYHGPSFVEHGSRGSTGTWPGSDRGVPDRRPQQ